MCDYKFKVGDKVFLTVAVPYPSILNIGTIGTILDNDERPFVQFDVDKNDRLHNAEGKGEDGKCYSVLQKHLELINSYKKSNRFKLSQDIKNTGLQSQDLSVANGTNKTYFSSMASESRFNDRGDLTESRYNELLTDLKNAERKLLDLAPKTVDENNVLVGNGEAFKVIYELNNSAFESSKQIHDAYVDYYVEAANDKNQKDNKAKKFLIVFVLLVIILAVYFFTR